MQAKVGVQNVFGRFESSSIPRLPNSFFHHTESQQLRLADDMVSRSSVSRSLPPGLWTPNAYRKLGSALLTAKHPAAQRQDASGTATISSGFASA
jgi:hypothetical protein